MIAFYFLVNYHFKVENCFDYLFNAVSHSLRRNFYVCACVSVNVSMIDALIWPLVCICDCDKDVKIYWIPFFRTLLFASV